MDGIVIDDDIKTTIQLSEEHIKGMLSKLVEQWMIFHIRINSEEIANLIYPDTIGDDRMEIYPLHVNTNTSEHRPFGYYTKGKSWRTVYGWHGDVALLLNSKKHGKRAIIFEVKFGHIQISAPQHVFFQKVVAEPESCLKKLKEAKVIIVHCFDLDLEKNELTTRWFEYHQTEDRWKNAE